MDWWVGIGLVEGVWSEVAGVVAAAVGLCEGMLCWRRSAGRVELAAGGRWLAVAGGGGSILSAWRTRRPGCSGHGRCVGGEPRRAENAESGGDVKEPVARSAWVQPWQLAVEQQRLGQTIRSCARSTISSTPR